MLVLWCGAAVHICSGAWLWLCIQGFYRLILYCVGNIKSATRVTNLVVTQEIIVTRGSCAYTYNDLPLPGLNHLA